MLGRRRTGLGASLAALAAAMLTGASGVAETLEGVVPEGGCEHLSFLITPGGSRALAARHLEPAPGSLQTVTTRKDGQLVTELARATQSLGVAFVSWDLAKGLTGRFELDDSGPPPRLSSQSQPWLLPLDEESFALRIQGGFAFSAFDLADGHTVGEQAILPGAPSEIVSSPAFDRRGPWIGAVRAIRELPTDPQTPARPPSSSERSFSAVNVATGETRELIYAWPDLAPLNNDDPWRLDRDGRVGLRVLRDGETLTLQLPLDPEGASWRTVLIYDALETFEPFPPDDFSPDTESILVVSDIGRSGPAAGRLDLATGAIDYFNDRRSRGLFLDVELSPRQDALLWETRRGESATGAGPITVDVSLAGAAVAAPGGSARAFDMSFGSEDAEALYDALREGWGHADVLDWADDGSAAIVELWGPDERRRVEAVSIADGSTVTSRRELCDTTRPSRFPEPTASRGAGAPEGVTVPTPP